jgi:hypothetical protein
MATAAGWKPTLKYSPRNGIIVDWAHGSQPFSMCCLPQRDCTPPTPAKPAPACTTALPMAETVETRDWHAFVPEILAGISGATEDMAAAYARQAGIEFAQKAWVLQRDVVMELQPKIYRYPFEPIGEERVVGALFILSSEGPCACNGSGGVFIGEVSVDQSRQELVLANTVRAGCCGAHVNRRGPKFTDRRFLPSGCVHVRALAPSRHPRRTREAAGGHGNRHVPNQPRLRLFTRRRAGLPAC